MAEIKIDIKMVTRAAVSAVQRFTSKAQSSFKGLSNTINQSRVAFGTIAVAATAAFTALNKVVTQSIQTFIDYEKALIGVGKTTGLAGNELQDFGKDIVRLSKTLPVTAKELLNIAQSAGQLGIRGTDNLEKFSTTVAKLGRTTNISGEEAAIAIARVLEVTNEGPGVVDRFGSSLVALGNNFAANEAEILRATNEIARGTAQFNLSSAAAAGLAATLKTFGVQSELAGSVTQRAFQAIGKAIAGGKKPLRDLQRLTGLTGKELKEQFETNAIGVFQKFIDGLGRVQGGSQAVTAQLKEFGLEGVRINAVLPTLAKRSETLAKALEIAGQEFETPVALTEEFDVAAQSLDARLVQLGNQFSALGIELGETLLPAINVAIKSITSVTNGLSWLNDNTKAVTNSMGGLSGIVSTTITKWDTITNSIKLAVAALGGLLVTTRETKGGLEDMGDIADTTATSLDDYRKSARNANDELEDMGVAAYKAIEGIQDLDTVLSTTQKNIQKNIRLWRKLRREQEENDIKNKENADQQLELDEKKLIATQDFLTKKRQLEIDAFAKADELAAMEDGMFTAREEAKILRAVDTHKRMAENEQLARQASINDARAFALLQAKIDKDRANRAVGIAKKESEAKREEDKKLLEAQQTFNSRSLSLSRSNEKEVAALGKAVAISNILRKTPEAIANAYTNGTAIGGPALGLVYGAVAAAFMRQQVKQVGNFENGGIVGGTSFTGDRMTANVNSGEMILNRQQQAQLFQQANGRGGTGAGQEIVVNTTVELDSEVVGRSVSRQVANGLVLGEFE